MYNFSFPALMCNSCNGVFQVIKDDEYDIENTQNQLKIHQESCSEDDKFLGDDNAVDYF